ncbi:MAG: LemA family protein [Clostridiales bacterium]|nr:LemA family protein [Clostridiales bacterium]
MDWVIIIIIAAIVLVLVFWWISASANYKRIAIKISEALSGMEAALTKRYDLLTKMLDAVKNHKQHEIELIAEGIKVRKGMSINELSQASVKMDNMASNLSIVTEAYPELRSSDIFKELHSGIRDSEERLQAATRLYNANVTSLNTAVKAFPSSIIAKAQNIKELEFFSAEEAKRGNDSMEF